MATAFNFNDWITKNKLDVINHLFIKYDMTTIETLSLQSKSFQKFICDPLLITTHHKLMGASIAAMQKLGHDTFDESSFIVISEEENAVIGRIKSDLSKLRGMPNELNDLKIKYLQSIERIRNDKLKQIQKAQHKVNQTFQNVITALNQKKQLILNQLQEMKHDVNQHEPMDALVSISSLQKAIAKLCEDLEECKAKIKSQTEIRNRQEDVLSIGQRAKETFEEISNEMNQNRDRVKRMIERNNGIRSGIDFMVNQRVYNRLVSPQNIGVIIDCNRDQKEEGHVIKHEVIDHQHFVPSETGSSNEDTSDVDISSNQEQSVSFEPDQNTNSHMDLSSDRAIISDDDSERTEDIDHQDMNTQSTEDDKQMDGNISEESRYYCKECDQHFKTKQGRTRHIERLHEHKKNYTCNECNAKFYRKRSYTKHIEKVHEQKFNYECSECHKTFYEKHHFKAHIERVHEGKRNYECNECHKEFYTKSECRKHVERVHEKKLNYGCQHCNAKFYRKCERRWHTERVHEGKRDYVCQHCDAKFYQKQDYTRHIERVHEGKTNYECNKCQKRFYAKYDYKMHIEKAHKHKTNNESTRHIEPTHGSKRKYKCKKCNASFYSKDRLAKHIKQTHNEEEKQYDCGYCEMVFSRKKDLKQHKLIHKAHKPHSCSICKKRFKKLSSRNKHQKTCPK